MARMAADRPVAGRAGRGDDRLPQVLINVPVGDRAAGAARAAVQAAVGAAEAELGETGRVLLRPSGTEPLVRVMVEAATEETPGRSPSGSPSRSAPPARPPDLRSARARHGRAGPSRFPDRSGDREPCGPGRRCRHRARHRRRPGQGAMPVPAGRSTGAGLRRAAEGGRGVLAVGEVHVLDDPPVVRGGSAGRSGRRRPARGWRAGSSCRAGRAGRAAGRGSRWRSASRGCRWARRRAAGAAADQGPGDGDPLLLPPESWAGRARSRPARPTASSSSGARAGLVAGRPEREHRHDHVVQAVSAGSRW